MKIGIIGAGRVGCSIGKYLRTKDIELAGYYDVDSAAAKEAAEFTRTESFDSLKQLADQSQIIFITTPDSFIIPVWEQLKELSLRNQIICHCSGALSSDSFSGRESMSVSCCSIHPMLPFSNRFSSYEQLNKAFFTVEGQDAAVEAAEIGLIDEDPGKIAVAYAIARKTVRIVQQNIVFALAVKIIVMVLGALGFANMWAAVFADVGVAFLAIINATRALKP